MAWSLQLLTAIALAARWQEKVMSCPPTQHHHRALLASATQSRWRSSTSRRSSGDRTRLRRRWMSWILVLRGRRARPINFGEISPVSPFGLVGVEAFDRGMPVSDWIGFYRYPDPRVIAALDNSWRKEVWSGLTTHFGIA